MRIIGFKDLYNNKYASNLSNIDINPQNGIDPLTLFNISPEAAFVKFESSVECRSFCNFLVHPKATLIIRQGVFFNNYCSVNCLGNIEIGENTLFGEGVKLYDHNHLRSYEDGILKIDRYAFDIGRIKIGKNCWIGSNVTILKDVEIGDNVIIGANNLLFKNIPANTIVRANTAFTLTTSDDH